MNRLPVRYATRITALWARRNNAPEAELEAIDEAMYSTVVAGREHALNHTPRRIVEPHNLHGTGDRRHTVFVLPDRGDRQNEYDYWALVTDVPCPACSDGTIRWHEAGYVPGYRM